MTDTDKNVLETLKSEKQHLAELVTAIELNDVTWSTVLYELRQFLERIQRIEWMLVSGSKR